MIREPLAHWSVCDSSDVIVSEWFSKSRGCRQAFPSPLLSSPLQFFFFPSPYSRAAGKMGSLLAHWKLLLRRLPYILSRNRLIWNTIRVHLKRLAPQSHRQFIIYSQSVQIHTSFIKRQPCVWMLHIFCRAIALFDTIHICVNKERRV